jgi:tRNA pseudouridine38-40 synthase
LPPDLAVRSLRPASPDFDPRRQARSRIYRYRVLTTGSRRPAERHRTLEIDDRLDVTAMRAAAERLVGERDFAALGSHPHGRTVRRLDEVTILRRGDLIEIRVVANAFLRRMVRSMVAVLLEVGRGRLAAERVAELMASGEQSGIRALSGRAAPARGLTLERVIYHDNDALAETERAGT